MSAGKAASPSPPDHLGRLLDGLEGRELDGASPEETIGDAITSRLLSAWSPEQVEQRLHELRRRGRGDLSSVLRALVACLPGCRTLRPSPRETEALRAMGRLVVLSRSPRQGAERFAGLVHAAIGEFNRGGIDRAERVFDLADRLLGAVRLDRALLDSLRESAHSQLDLDRLRRIIESRGRVPAGMLRLFRVFAPEALVDRFGQEPRRQRRELLLSLLEAHGPGGRAIARDRLLQATAGPADPSAVARLVQLLRRLPGSAEDGRTLEREVRSVARLLVPHGPPALVDEALAYLGRAPHACAGSALVLFLRELEGMAAESVASGARRPRLITALDRVAEALARTGAKSCWAALVRHGLSLDPRLGDTARRLVPLGAHDLGRTPDLAIRMIAAIKECLPRGLFTPVPATESPRVLQIVAALRATRMPEVLELFEFLAARFPLQDVGAVAERSLAAFDAQPAAEAATASLSGDLRLFGLPVLLQNLADGRVTGVLTLGDTARPVARIVLDQGRLRSVRVGAKSGPAALYQLLQRPFSGRFRFLHRQGLVTWGGEPPSALALPELILEGLRRCDELEHLASRVPDDAAFEATGRPPTVANGWDIDLVTRLWERAIEGASPLACEEALGVDAWQVRRCLAQWLEDASLLPRPGGGTRPDYSTPSRTGDGSSGPHGHGGGSGRIIHSEGPAAS